MTSSILVPILVAILSFIGSLILGIMQFKTNKHTSKKEDVSAYTDLINTAMLKSKTEFDIMSDLVGQLRTRINDLQEENTELKKDNEELSMKLDLTQKYLPLDYKKEEDNK